MSMYMSMYITVYTNWKCKTGSLLSVGREPKRFLAILLGGSSPASKSRRKGGEVE